MNIKLIFRTIPLAAMLLMLLAGPALAQRPIDIEEVRVVAPYVPTVSDAFKINDNPRIDDTTAAKPVFSYNIIPRRLSTRFVPEPIAAARMRGEPLVKLYQGHLRGGFGTSTTPYAEVFYNTLRSDEYALGMHLRHLSSAGTIKDHAYSGFSENRLHLFGKRFFGDNTLDGGLRYNRDVIHYYGYKPGELEFLLPEGVAEPERNDIRQRISQLNTRVGFGSHHPDSTRTRFGAGLEHNWLNDRYEATEHNLLFNGKLGYGFDDPFGFMEQVYLDLNTKVDFFHNANPADTSNTAVISLLPRLTARFNNFRLFAGLDLSVQSDTASYFRVYPQAGMEANIIERYLTVHAGLTGGLHRYSLRELMLENPFMTSKAPLGFMNKKAEITGGIKGAFSDNIAYNLSVSSARLEDYAFFVTDTSALLNNQFTLIYDNMRRLHLRGELFSQFGSRFNARLSADYFQYNPETEIEAWHLPALQLGLNLKYNMQDKIVVSADLFGRSTTFGRTFSEENTPLAVELHGLHIDANLGIEYRYTRILSFFVNFHNVQGKSFERWLNYPSQRFNVTGGLTWSF